VGLDHLAIGVSSRAELEQLAEVLRGNGVAADLHHDPLGPAVVSFRDPDNIQWEFFEQFWRRGQSGWSQSQKSRPL
jgi:glyoxylase I family protein